MYQLIQLSDLESDFINPHDATRNINWVVVRHMHSGWWGAGQLPLAWLRKVGILHCDSISSSCMLNLAWQ